MALRRSRPYRRIGGVCGLDADRTSPGRTAALGRRPIAVSRPSRPVPKSGFLAAVLAIPDTRRMKGFTPTFDEHLKQLTGRPTKGPARGVGQAAKVGVNPK